MQCAPLLFQQDGRIVRIRSTEHGTMVQPLDYDSLRHHLDHAATFVSNKQTRDGAKSTSAEFPPIDIVRNIMAMPRWPNEVFPVLKGLSPIPFFRTDGTLVNKRGFDVATGVWYEPTEDLEDIEIPESPTLVEVGEACEFLLEEFLYDLPFAELSDRANAMGFLLTPFSREMLGSLVPMLVVDAPVQGTGKSLLLKLFAMVATGQDIPMKSAATNDDEWRKVITSILTEAPPWVVFDNVEGKLDSASLAALLTSSTWSDRELGKNRILRMYNRTIWSATANNLEISQDLARRIVWVRLDAKTEFPDQRSSSSFRHPNILEWTRMYRRDIITSLLTLIRYWVVKGCPKGKKTLGSFEQWATTIGGILEPTSFLGFLDNADEQRLRRDDDSADMRVLCERWWTTHKAAVVGIKDIFPLISEDSILPKVQVGASETAQRQRLGHVIKKNIGRIYGGYKICRSGEDRCDRKLYRLEADPGILAAELSEGTRFLPPIDFEQFLSLLDSTEHLTDETSQSEEKCDEAGEYDEDDLDA